MAHGKGKYDPRITSVSPLWKHSSGSSVVTLKMRPPATPLTSLDTFMAAHSPRRFCQTRQRYLLKPLGLDDKRITEAGLEPVVNEKDVTPIARSRTKPKGSQHNSHIHVLNDLSRNAMNSPSTSTSAQDSSSDQEQSYSRILPLGKCKLSTEEEFFNGCESQDKVKAACSSFRPNPRLPYTFSRSASIPNTPRDNTDLIAIGTISMTSQRQPVLKPQSRWKTKATLNLKGSKYPEPLPGAPPSFHARMSEIAQLELETIKYEKSRKTKKKSPT